jgi:hypothetical protein
MYVHLRQRRRALGSLNLEAACDVRGTKPSWMCPFAAAPAGTGQLSSKESRRWVWAARAECATCKNVSLAAAAAGTGQLYSLQSRQTPRRSHLEPWRQHPQQLDAYTKPDERCHAAVLYCGRELDPAQAGRRTDFAVRSVTVNYDDDDLV